MADLAFQYDDKRFRSSAVETAAGNDVPVGHYHQSGDLVWAEFAGGKVRQGSLVGTCAGDGVLTLAYCQVLTTGEVISGECRSVPERLPDGRIRLREEWRRHGSAAGNGISYIEEIPVPALN